MSNAILSTNGSPLTVNLSRYFNTTATPSNLVRVFTSLGAFNMQLLPASAPKTVANFLAYANDGAYENTLIHRSVPGFIIQTGGYTDGGDSTNWSAPIATFTNIVPSEASNGLPNNRGTVSMALVGADSNSATDQWFINLTNNASSLDVTNNAKTPVYGSNGTITFEPNPPFTVFAQVLGNGMQVVDSIAQLPIYTNLASPFNALPLLSNSPSISNLVTIKRVATLPFFALSSDPSSYATQINGTNLIVSYVGGTNPPASPVTISVFAYDTNGLMTNSSFQVWSQTNAVRTISYPQYTNQSYSTNGFNMAFYPYSSDGTPIPANMISWKGPVVFTGYTNGYNHFAFTNVGTITFTYVQPGNFFYQPITNSSSFVVSAASQTITFQQITNQTYSTNPFLLTNPPSSSSGLPLNISIAAGSPMTVMNNKFYMTGVGTVSLVASTTTNVFYVAATPFTNTFAITAAPQTINFPALSNQILPVSPFALKATSSVGLPVTFSLISNSPALITNGNTLRINGPGVITVVANQAGTNVYLPAVSVTNCFRAASNQTIAAFAAIPNRTYSNPSLILSITNIPKSSSGLPVAVSVLSGPASLLSTNSNSATLSIAGAGTITLAADQTGNSNYFSAPEVTTFFVVAKAPQTISSFTGIPSPLSNGMSFSVTTPSTSSGLTNSILTASGAGMIVGNTVTLTNSGTLTLTANNIGNTNYLPASLSTNITVLKGSQTITFTSPASPLMAGTTRYGLSATASSGLPVSYTLTPAGANVTLVSNAISVNAYTSNNAPSYTVVASQAGNSGWYPATPVTNTFTTMPYQSATGGAVSVNGGASGVSFISSGGISTIASNSYSGTGSVTTSTLNMNTSPGNQTQSNPSNSNTMTNGNAITPSLGGTGTITSSNSTYYGAITNLGSITNNATAPSPGTTGLIFSPTPTPSPTP